MLPRLLAMMPSRQKVRCSSTHFERASVVPCAVTQVLSGLVHAPTKHYVQCGLVCIAGEARQTKGDAKKEVNK